MSTTKPFVIDKWQVVRGFQGGLKPMRDRPGWINRRCGLRDGP